MRPLTFEMSETARFINFATFRGFSSELVRYEDSVNLNFAGSSCLESLRVCSGAVEPGRRAGRTARSGTSPSLRRVRAPAPPARATAAAPAAAAKGACASPCRFTFRFSYFSYFSFSLRFSLNSSLWSVNVQKSPGLRNGAVCPIDGCLSQ